MCGRNRSYVRLSTCCIVKDAQIYASASCESIDYEMGIITFKNGRVVSADLIVGADGIKVNTPSINFDTPLKRCFQVCCPQTNWHYPEHARGSTDLLQM